ncbi:uncharacterized protein LOC132551534 [Ylistrum balloti]|uniref:uncharacterized protein LOC132551534 n=1 Tax=Ylistrum balloti TaxID=509963 RepID=UPI002905F0A9|nr:uncharacterized protein LOC132551534 [Ylistrum balloti]
MNIGGLSLSFYCLLVFLQGAICGVMAYRHRNANYKRISWRLKLLRKIYAQFDDTEDLLKVTDRRHSEKYSADPDHKANIYYDTISDHHLPIIECADKENEIPCPTPIGKSKYYCIRRKALCDRKIHCPHGEDENLVACMFYKSINMKINEVYAAMSLLNRLGRNNTTDNMRL